MGYSRFVRPDVTVLTLANGDTLTVKKRLTQGERTVAYTRIYATEANGTRNPFVVDLAMVTAYLIDWSLVGLDGAPVPIRGLSIDELTAIINTLDPEDFSEISAVITAHEQRMREERAAEKKSQAGVSNGSLALSSPAA